MGGNLPAHEEANRKGTEVSDAETTAALSAAKEQYKRFRVKENPDESVHVPGDTRTQKEIELMVQWLRIKKDKKVHKIQHKVPRFIAITQFSLKWVKTLGFCASFNHGQR